MKTSHKYPRAFSLIEVLVALAILAVMAAIIVPRYLQVARQANIQVAAQQVDTVRKAVLAWLAAQPSVSAGSTAYDNNGTGPTAGYPLATSSGVINTLATSDAWSQIGNYLDSNFASQLTITQNGSVTYFTTPQMSAVTGGTLSAPTSTTNPPLPTGCPAVGTIDALQSGAASTHTACGVIYWPTSTASRATGQPVGILYYKP